MVRFARLQDYGGARSLQYNTTTLCSETSVWHPSPPQATCCCVAMNIRAAYPSLPSILSANNPTAMAQQPIQPSLYILLPYVLVTCSHIPTYRAY